MRGIWNVLHLRLILLLFFLSPGLISSRDIHTFGTHDAFGDEDSVVIEDDIDRHVDREDLGFDRNDRQLPNIPFDLNSSKKNSGANIYQPCLTSTGRLGRCTSLKVCYPYFKSPNIIGSNTWIKGLYDTCSYIGKRAQQVFGVCCTGIQMAAEEIKDSSENNNKPTQPPFPIKRQEDNNKPTQPSLPIKKQEDNIEVTHQKNSLEKDYDIMEGEEDQELEIRNTTNTKDLLGVKLSSDHCGQRFFSNNLKIVNGEDASVDEFPFMAALFNKGRHFCGGSIIDSKHILTAAHCVAHMTKIDVRYLRVHVRQYRIKSSNIGTEQEFRVRRVIRHKSFSANTLYNDVAILTLRGSIDFSKSVQPICLASDNTETYEGDIVTVAGWGTLSDGGRQSSILQKVSVGVWSNYDCGASYGSRAPGGIKSHMLCAASKGKDSCSGDSGGPLFYCDTYCTQIGIVSWGIGCARKEFPGVYTRVTSLHSWIQKIRKNH